MGVTPTKLTKTGTIIGTMDSKYQSVSFEEVRAMVGHPGDCPHEEWELRNKVTSGGSARYWRQCLSCGQKVGSQIQKFKSLIRRLSLHLTSSFNSPPGRDIANSSTQ